MPLQIGGGDCRVALLGNSTTQFVIPLCWLVFAWVLVRASSEKHIVGQVYGKLSTNKR